MFLSANSNTADKVYFIKLLQNPVTFLFQPPRWGYSKAEVQNTAHSSKNNKLVMEGGARQRGPLVSSLTPTCSGVLTKKLLLQILFTASELEGITSSSVWLMTTTSILPKFKFPFLESFGEFAALTVRPAVAGYGQTWHKRTAPSLGFHTLTLLSQAQFLPYQGSAFILGILCLDTSTSV